MKIRPIRDEADHAAALAEIERLWEKADPGTEELDALDVLATLVEAFERDRYPIEPPDPVEAIRFRMEQLALDRKDLVQFLGHPSKVSEVLGHRRQLSLAMIRKLHAGLGIPAESLIQPVDLAEEKAPASTPRRGRPAGRVERDEPAPKAARDKRAAPGAAKAPVRAERRRRGSEPAVSAVLKKSPKPTPVRAR